MRRRSQVLHFFVIFATFVGLNIRGDPLRFLPFYYSDSFVVNALIYRGSSRRPLRRCLRCNKKPGLGRAGQVAHGNPVRRGLVQPEQWIWSSYVAQLLDSLALVT
jgi:hypothetical protein